jgi:hypothetical protein
MKNNIMKNNIMKTNVLNKDTNFSLFNSENYYKDIDDDVSKIINKYAQLIIEYSKFVKDNIKVKNRSFATFITIRGLDTITNVFNYILYFTKNVDLTYYHCQKSFYFYIEFVGQITEDDKMFLQLTTRDATSYVYKKTIFDINNELKKVNQNTSEAFREKIDTIQTYIKLYQTYLLKIIQTNNHNNICSNIEHLVNLSDKLTNYTKKNKISSLEVLTEKLYYKIEDIQKFFEINHLIVKQFLKNSEVIKNAEQKLNTEVFEEKIVESNEKFVIWFLS